MLLPSQFFKDEIHNCVKKSENSLSPPQMNQMAPTDPVSNTATENPNDFPLPSAMIPPQDIQVVTSFSSDDIGLQQTADLIENKWRSLVCLLPFSLSL